MRIGCQTPRIIDADRSLRQLNDELSEISWKMQAVRPRAVVEGDSAGVKVGRAPILRDIPLAFSLDRKEKILVRGCRREPTSPIHILCGCRHRGKLELAQGLTTDLTVKRRVRGTPSRELHEGLTYEVDPHIGSFIRRGQFRRQCLRTIRSHNSSTGIARGGLRCPITVEGSIAQIRCRDAKSPRSLSFSRCERGLSLCGSGGIRTHGAGLPLNGFQDHLLRPLGHASNGSQ